MITNETTPGTPIPPEEDLLLAIALCGVETLTDTQLLSTLLDHPEPSRAESILHESGSLALLENEGPVALKAMGLSTPEVLRLATHAEVTSRIAKQRRGQKLGTLADAVESIRLRAHRWDSERVGLTILGREQDVLVDKLLFVGSPWQCPVDIQAILREVIRAGGAGMVLYRWLPSTELSVLGEDLILGDHLRLAASAVGIEVVDYILVSHQACWSSRIACNWV